ncbi:Wadjet anti-phage system protein JetD domain-containing protein [Paenibacillus hamazuiensis]|uniref:Wadjet anti-phage system protein JetD domain-containing protein n=1 Tax=Paenibacillus hamazuiensis TaxID=2936508 RepID=UPI00200F6E4B|nr:Wadjet anti-phage system protein JetD domain-containing protein [Paenibacillus hamazuiensis]
MELNESSYKRQFTRRLLDILLGKYEQSQSFATGVPGKQRPQLAMGKSPFTADYNDEMDFRKRQWMNEALLELEHLGVLELVWAKFSAGTDIDKVILPLDRVQQAYGLAGIVPLKEKLERLRQVLAPLANHPWVWVRKWREKADAALSQGKSPHLDVDDPSGYEDLVRALSELPLLEGNSVSIRLFSQRLFQDSKHLERSVLKRLLALAKMASGEQRDTEEEWLDLLGLARNPQYVWLSGPLTFQIDSRELSCEPFAGGVGLSAETVRKMTEVATTARRIVTIENLTSYHQWLEQRCDRSAEELVIYTGGYPRRLLQSFFRKLSGAVRPAGDRLMPEAYHWGDIDIGGIRIYEYVKARFIPHLQPLWMDAATLLKYEAAAAEASEEYAVQLRQALSDPQYADWRPVLEMMLEKGIRLEQEVISDVTRETIAEERSSG